LRRIANTRPKKERKSCVIRILREKGEGAVPAGGTKLAIKKKKKKREEEKSQREKLSF